MIDLTHSATEGGAVLDAPFDSLPAALEAAVRIRGQRPALRYFDSSLTFGEVRDIVDALAAHWQQQGIGHGDRILIQLQNVPQFAFAAMAAWELGAVAVPVSPMYRAREIRKIVEDSRPVAWVTSPDVWEQQGADAIDGTSVEHVLLTRHTDCCDQVPQALAALETAAVDGAEDARVRAYLQVIEEFRGRRPERAAVGPDDVAALTYTSGTTGPPKGAKTTHRNMLWVGRAYPSFNDVAGPDQVLLATAPLVHITGLSMHLGSWLTEACELVLGYRFDAAQHLDLMERHRVTWTTGATTVYLGMLQELGHAPRDLGALRFLGCGGAAVPTEMARRIRSAFGVDLKPGYGLTESTAAVTSTPPAEDAPVDAESGIISVGKPLFDIRVRIAGPDGEAMPARERGEVLLAGPGVVSGYWERDDETSAAFVDGWLRTGDIGFVDEDDWLYIVDRTKNLIVSSGYKIWPREVEEVLFAHHALGEVAVVGAAHDYRGETVVACVTLAEGVAPERWPALEVELRSYCKQHLAAYKVPTRFLLKSELPKNFNGKVQHRELRAEAERAVAAEERA